VHNEFTAIIEQDGAWDIAYCLEIPGANGQGHTPDEARESLAEAMALILADRREDGWRGVPPEAIRETVIVGGNAAVCSSICGGTGVTSSVRAVPIPYGTIPRPVRWRRCRGTRRSPTASHASSVATSLCQRSGPSSGGMPRHSFPLRG